MSIQITFLGAAQTVTGSKTLVSYKDQNILVDCGFYQGPEAAKVNNETKLPIPAHEIDAVIITHSHLDHCGYLPKLFIDGFRGPIYCTPVTRSITPIILKDAARIQMNDLKETREKSKRHPNKFKALYSEHDVNYIERFYKIIDFETPIQLGGFKLCFHRAGHIPGAASAGLTCEGGSLLFSGDLGRYEDPFSLNPLVTEKYDNVVLESTYGGNFHSKESPVEQLKTLIKEIDRSGGTLLIAAFSLARTQALLFLLEKAYEELGNTEIPIFMDSPMATEITNILAKYPEEYHGDLNKLRDNFQQLHILDKPWHRKELEKTGRPKLILSASGMLTGGKIVTHLTEYIEEKRNILFLPGHQVEGTLGHSLIQGLKSIKIEKKNYEVNAKIVHSTSFSAHADEDELISWLKNLKSKPKRIYLNHGEEKSIADLKKRISEEFPSVATDAPKPNESFLID